MNVEYRCPTCGSRHFAPPGGSTYRCGNCDVQVKQVEDWGGPDFGYVDPTRGVNQSKTGHVQTHGAAQVVVERTEIESVFETNDLAQLRALYMKIFNEMPDGRWGVKRLKEAIHDELVEQGLAEPEVETEADGDIDDEPEDDSGKEEE